MSEKKEMTPEETLSTEVEEELTVEDNLPDYRHHFSKPFVWMGKTFETLDFHFGELTGKDALQIYQELSSRGVMVLSPRTSPQYQVILASKASKLGTDAFEAMPYKDFETILAKTRNFIPTTALL